MDNKYQLDDLVVSAIEEKPLDFETAFNNLVIDKIRAAVEDKKVQIAQQMYNYDPEAETEEEKLDGEESE